MLDDKEKNIVDYLVSDNSLKPKTTDEKRRIFIGLAYDKTIPKPNEIKVALDENLSLGQLFINYNVPHRIVDYGDYNSCEFQAHLVVWSITREYEEPPTLKTVNEKLIEMGLNYTQKTASHILRGRELEYTVSNSIPKPILYHMHTLLSVMGLEDCLTYHKELLGGTSTPLNDLYKWKKILESLDSSQNKEKETKDKEEKPNNIHLSIGETNSQNSESQLRSLANSQLFERTPKGNKEEHYIEENKQLKTNLRISKGELKSSESKLKQYKIEIDEYEKEVKSLESELSTKELAIISLKSEINKLKKGNLEIDKLQKELLKYKKINLDYKDLVNKLRNNNKEQSNNALNTNLSDFEIIHSLLESNIKKLKTGDKESKNYKLNKLLIEVLEILN